MYQRKSVLFGVLAAMVIAAACGTTDAGLASKVKANLTADETVKVASIDVGAQKKVVTLSGAVDTPAVKERAVAVARQTDGVADVVDQMTVKDQGSLPGPGPGRGPEMMEKGMKMGGKDHPNKANE